MLCKYLVKMDDLIKKNKKKDFHWSWVKNIQMHIKYYEKTEKYSKMYFIKKIY